MLAGLGHSSVGEVLAVRHEDLNPPHSHGKPHQVASVAIAPEGVGTRGSPEPTNKSREPNW